MRPWNDALWQTLSPLLDRALDLAPDMRSAFLAGVRADNETLANALEGLLAEHDQVLASEFLEASVSGESTPPSLAGQRVGAYTLERPLGMGGMGTVWLARRSDGRFEGAAAVKFVNLAVFDRVGQERFRREGTFLARLSHPHIARLFDAGVTEAGQPFLILEYVEGTGIDRYAAERRLALDARLELFLQVADAVAHAHANLIVHRDLKPSNVLVDANGQVKLLDFGIATLVDTAPGDAPRTLTLAGARALTPEYAAPEQVTGGAITTATDVYALGVLLYQLLVGRHPTAPPDGPTHAATLLALTEQDPLRLSEVVARLIPGDPEAARILHERGTTRDRLRRACRGDLDTILGMALKKDPGVRFQTVTALAEDLRRHIRHEPVTARPDSLWYRTRAFAARHRLEVGAAAAIVLALVVGTGIAVSQARSSARERDRALELLRRAEATNDFSNYLLTQATPRGKPISHIELLAEGEAVITRRFTSDPILRVHMLLSLADRYQENQQFDAWRRVLQRAYDESRTLDDAGLRAYATCAWSLQFAEQGDAAKALAIIGDALPVVASHPDYAEYESGCRVLESTAARITGDGVRAVAAAERAVALEERRAGLPFREIEASAALAAALNISLKYSAADAAYRRVTAMLDAQGLGDTRHMAIVLNNWSAMLANSGRLLQAVDVAARAVRTAQAADSDNGASLTMLTTYGVALSSTGNHVEAIGVFDEAIDKARAAGSPPRLIRALTDAVTAACAAGDVHRGMRLLAEAESLLPSDKSAYSKGLLEAATARVALVNGDRARAVEWARRAVSTLESATPTRLSVLATWTLLARTLNVNGDYAEALSFAERSLASAEQRRADQQHTAAIGLALLEIAIARHGLGETAAPRESVARALEHLNSSVGPDAEPTDRAERLRRLLTASAKE